MKPKRIQHKRARGWKMPRSTIYVGRPTIWGNRFGIGNGGWNRTTTGVAFEILAKEMWDDDPALYREWLKPLRGHDLACWCKLDQPCHADTLLRLANAKGLNWIA